MARSTVLNNFSQTPGPLGAEDNVLQLGGTVFQKDGTQAADPGTAVGTDAVIINAIITALKNTGIIAT